MNHCAATAKALDNMCGSGGVLGLDSEFASHRLHVDNPRRRRILDRIIEEYLAEQEAVVTDGQFLAIATAGVPGAGKSTSVKRHVNLSEGWRVLDADRVKDHLIRSALAHGDYRDILSKKLPDGGTVMPRELATLVHFESTKIVDELQAQCMGRGENIVIEGTFSWPELGERLLRQLGAAGYEGLTILDVEVTCEQAQERALGRWWDGRTSGNSLGGRFTPAVTIAGMYPEGSVESICAVNARKAFNNPLTAEIASVQLFVEDYTSGKKVERIATKHKGVTNYESDLWS